MSLQKHGNTRFFCGPTSTVVNVETQCREFRGKWRCTVTHANIDAIHACRLVSLWAIYHEDKLLLALGNRHKDTGMYSTLAGFVESGESLEQAVHREVKEEVGVDVKNLEYFGSQPWPFPHSLMVGYIAEYAGGDIVLDDDEICDANWYAIDALPKVPPTLSIAGQLIEESIRRIKSKTTKNSHA